MSRSKRWLAGALLLWTLAQPNAEAKMALTLTSSAFSHGGEIPALHTCSGRDVSPPLAWTGVPQGTRSLVLIVDDPDAPDPKAPTMTWVHWIVYNIPPTLTAIPQAASTGDVGPQAQFGLNDWKRTGYGGPCPPIGRHRYVHKLYALDTTLTGLDAPTKPQVEAAMKGHILAHAELVGSYQKSQ